MKSSSTRRYAELTLAGDGMLTAMLRILQHTSQSSFGTCIQCCVRQSLVLSGIYCTFPNFDAVISMIYVIVADRFGRVEKLVHNSRLRISRNNEMRA